MSKYQENLNEGYDTSLSKRVGKKLCFKNFFRQAECISGNYQNEVTITLTLNFSLNTTWSS